jgi:cytochrome c-type biogenesis protein CcmF
MIFGIFAIWLAMIGTLVSTGAYFRWMLAERRAETGGKRDQEALLRAEASIAPVARWGLYLSLAMLALAILQIETAAYKHDFSLSYIARFSNRAEPADYLFATLWAGQEGTFLLWCTYISLFGIAIRKFAKHYEASVMFFLNIIRLSLLVVLVGKSPFAPVAAILPEALRNSSTFAQTWWAFFHPSGLNLSQVPADGQGLNPLLQNPWMRIHPPTLFLGFAACAVPFAFAMAAMWKRDYEGWVKRALPWTALAFTVLGTGIMMGGYWAYAVLGWGGYWGWDPVENGSKVPWLFTVVLLHAMLIQQRRNTMHRLTALLGLMPFLFVMYSSFLTRSGILQDFSVHSFAKEDDLFPYLIGPLCFFWAIGVGMWLVRYKSFPKHQIEAKPWTAAAFIHWAVGLISLFAMLVWLGMSSPLITGIAAGIREAVPSLNFLPKATSNVGTGYYNTIATPIAVLGALMMSLVPILSWRKANLDQSYKKAVVPYLLTCVVVGLAAAYGVGRDRPGFELFRWGSGADVFRLMLPAQIPLLSLIFAGSMCLFMSLQTVILAPKKSGRLGGYLSHAGIGLLLVGVVTSELSDQEQKVSLVKGQPTPVMGYTATYTGMQPPKTKDDKPAMAIRFARGSESFVAPTPVYFSDINQQFNYAPYIHKYPSHDLYIAPQGPPMTTKEMAQRPVELKQGQESETINGVSVRLDKITGHGDASSTMRVGAVVTVTNKGKKDQVEPFWLAGTDQQVQSYEATTKDGQVTVAIGEMDVNTKGFTLIVGGHALGEPLGPPQEIALLSVSTKPMINLVWLATFLVMCGGLLAVRQAFADLGRADARDREYYEDLEGEEEAVEDLPRKHPAPKTREAAAGAHYAEGTANP